MPRKGENIYKRKDGRWEGRIIKGYDINGKAKYRSIYGKTYSEVKLRIRDYQIDCAIQDSPKTAHLISYSNLLTLWLGSIKPTVKESSFARYYQIIETHIKPQLGKYQVNLLTNLLISQYIEQLLETGRIDGTGGLSPKTVDDILAVIKSTLQFGKENGFVVHCNTKNLTAKRVYNTERVLSKDEQDRLKDYLLSHVDRRKLAVLLSLYTGIRLGEVCALRWRNLNVKDGVIEIRETMQRIKCTSPESKVKTKVIITTPKSSCSNRDIPIPEFLLEVIRPFECSPDCFVLTGSPSKYIEPRTLQYQFKRYISSAGINEVNYHALRHTFATRCIEVGFEIKSLSEILGHANVNITLNRYVHSSMKLKKENMNKLNL